jgi:NAD(P)-dependent dehydrogenase (short-subunit alcohol dehydrogenase family)
MGISFAKAGASRFVIVARSDISTTAEAIKSTSRKVGHSEPEILAIQADCSSPESVEALAGQVKQAFGHLDIVINNAAILSMQPILESDPAEWMKVLTVNVFGPYLVVRALLPLLLKGESKTIVNVCSVGAHCVTPTISAYQISKLAVLRLTEFICAEHDNDGIVAYSIHPGNVPTTMGSVDDLPPVYRPGRTPRPFACLSFLTLLCSLCRNPGAQCRFVSFPHVSKAIVAGRTIYQPYLGSAGADSQAR